MTIGQRIHGKGSNLLRAVYWEAHYVMGLNPLDGILISVQNVLRFKLFLLRIYVQDIGKDIILELG